MNKQRELGLWALTKISGYFLRYLGPDYMSRAGPVSRAGLSLPGSRHVC